jgi:hypothetical protein
MRATRVNILTSGVRPAQVRLGHLASAFTPSSRDWHSGSSYPVTAAQLSLIFTGFLNAASHLPADQTRLAALLEQPRVALTGRNRKEPDAILFPGSLGGKKKAPTFYAEQSLAAAKR